MEQEVLAGLQKDRCVIISGGPGEGKTALAQKVVWDMWERGELHGGAYPVNLAGERFLLLKRLTCKMSCTSTDLGNTLHASVTCMHCAGLCQVVEECSEDVRSSRMCFGAGKLWC